MAIKFTEDTTTHLRFPYGDYRELEGNFGPQFIYTVEGGSGRSDRLFASPDLHRAIQGAGVNPGTELSITATRSDKRRRLWLVTPAHKPKKPQATPDKNDGQGTASAEPEAVSLWEEDPSERPAPRPANGNGDSGRDAHASRPSSVETDSEESFAELAATNGEGDGEAPLPRELEQMGRLMGLCLHASAMAWQHVIHGRQGPDDVRAVGITLFLECARKGVSAEELLQGLPF